MPDSRSVAVVTGSGKARVGNRIVRDLAADGWRTVVHYRSSEEQARQTVADIEAAGGTAIACRADLSEESDVSRLVGTAVDAFGRLDAMVHTAAIYQPHDLDEVDAALLRKYWEANTLSSYLCGLHAGRAMVTQDAGGAVVLFGDWAIARPYPRFGAYFPSKGAVPTTVAVLARELAERNPQVRVNAILPGPVLLPPDTSDEERDRIAAGTLVKRIGTPEDISDAVRFLLRNTFVTGVCLPVDGGRTIHAGETRQ